jgi:hypothetical protein
MMNLRGKIRKDVDWIHVTHSQKRDQWWALLNTAMNHTVL